MKADRYLKVLYQGRLAGTLALTPEKKAAFEYADEWQKDGFSISPFSLPLKNRYSSLKKTIFTACSAYLRTACRMRGEIFY